MMKRRWIRLLIALLLLSPFAAGAQAWITYRPSSGSYEVKFPGQPKERSQTSSGQQGAVGVFVASYAPAPDKVFMVSVSGFANNCSGKQVDVQVMLDNARDSALNSFKGQMKLETIVQQSGFNGRQLVFQGTNFQAVQRSFFDVRKCKLYQILAIGSQDPAQDPSAKFFFDSFKILK